MIGDKNIIHQWCASFMPEPMLTNIYHIVDRLFGLCSIACLFSAVGIFGSWQLQKPLVQSVNIPTKVETLEGSAIYLPTAATLEHHGVIVYQAWVLDTETNVVYTFPEMSVSPNQKLALLEFPKTLPKGRYSVRGTIKYQLNPIKQVTLPVNYGIVEVE